MTENQKEIARKIIYAVETGGQVYGKVRYDCYVGKNTNSTKETACTIGGAGNHAGTAKKLMLMILAAYPDVFRRNDTAGIEADLNKSWESYDPGVGSKKAKCIQKIISTPEGIKCQDAFLDQQISSRIEKVEDMGVTNLDAQLMCANIVHLGGYAALERILKKATKPYTLNNIYAALKTDQSDPSSDNQVGDKKYWSRHEKVYQWLKEKITGGTQMVSVVLAGHGSGKPSTKGMNAYCSSRQAQDRGLVEVRRLDLTEAQRQQMHDLYATILGRNLYSQALRLYVYKKYNGNYYSDCSSSICKTAEKVGISGVATLNTAGMHYNWKKVDDVVIKNGIIQNPEVLKVGDALMFKGSDPSRPLQIGHTEMVYEINGTTASAATPTTSSTKTDIVKAGQMHTNNFTGAGLKVDGVRGTLTKKAFVMAIQIALNLDYNAGLAVDGKLGTKTKAALKGKTVRTGSKGYLVTALEIGLMLKGYNPNGVECPGVFGTGCAGATEKYQGENSLAVDKIAGYNTFMSLAV